MAGDWIDWSPPMGRPAKGPSGDVAAIKLRSGAEISPLPRETAWEHVGSNADIVAYRAA